MEGQSALQERIRSRAYTLWEQAGRPHGTALSHWLEAEREMETVVAPGEPAAPPKRTRSRTSAKAAPKAEAAKPKTRRTKAKADA
ncbi:MAG: hypothetical protein CMM50_03730 [Rhodospirillaceae bacterium]|nr:hypothetical protein [Rhodospirillaceae bacterium]